MKLDLAETNVGGAVLLDTTGKRDDRVEQLTGLSNMCKLNILYIEILGDLYLLTKERESYIN